MLVKEMFLSSWWLMGEACQLNRLGRVTLASRPMTAGAS